MQRSSILSFAVVLSGCLMLISAETNVSVAKAADNTPPAKAASAKQPAGKQTKDESTTAAESKESGPPVLDPSHYYGAAAMGYAAAKAAPEVVKHLFCYCGCDVTDHHQHVLDCFTSTHGVDCHICQEEAVYGLRLKREGKSIAEIQRLVDEQYARYYPFSEPTQAYKNYQSTRLYKAADGKTAESATTSTTAESSKAGEEKSTRTATAAKVKPGFKVGSCCSEDEHKK